MAFRLEVVKEGGPLLLLRNDADEADVIAGALLGARIPGAGLMRVQRVERAGTFPFAAPGDDSPVVALVVQPADLAMSPAEHLAVHMAVAEGEDAELVVVDRKVRPPMVVHRDAEIHDVHQVMSAVGGVDAARLREAEQTGQENNDRGNENS